ncbi:hypothetical protein SprV_0401429300 [Sparganum proliferum]
MSVGCSKTRAESSVMMKFLFGLLLILPVVICAGEADSSSETATTPNTTTAVTTAKPTDSPGGSDVSGSSSDASVSPQSSPSSDGSSEATLTSGVSALSMTQCPLLPFLLALFAKL